MGYSGHKHQKGLKELTIAENNGFIIAPLTVRPVNQHDTTLLQSSLEDLADTSNLVGFDLRGSYLTLDAGFDSEENHERIVRMGMIPIIKPNQRGTKDVQKRAMREDDFNEQVYKERYRIERTFAWQDTYRKLVIRYEILESTHLGFKYLAYSLVNLRGLLGRRSL